jgi:uncharacterized protein (TIGR02611 family)
MTDSTELTGSRRVRLASRLSAVREQVRAKPGGALIWRAGVTVVGLVVVAVGIVLLPLPGPGWLIIFAGFGVLATEYPWAGRVLRRLQAVVGRWTRWAADQHVSVQAALALAGVAFLVGVAVGSWYLARLV